MFQTRDGTGVLCIIEGSPYSLGSLVWDVQRETSDVILSLSELPDLKDELIFELHASGTVYTFSLHTTLKFDQGHVELSGRESSRRDMNREERVRYMLHVL